MLGARRTEALEALAVDLRAAGTRDIARGTDVVDPDSCTALVEAGVAELGRIDALIINNAGVGTAVPALRGEPADFRRVLEVNLMGSYRPGPVGVDARLGARRLPHVQRDVPSCRTVGGHNSETPCSTSVVCWPPGISRALPTSSPGG